MNEYQSIEVEVNFAEQLSSITTEVNFNEQLNYVINVDSTPIHPTVNELIERVIKATGEVSNTTKDNIYLLFNGSTDISQPFNYEYNSNQALAEQLNETNGKYVTVLDSPVGQVINAQFKEDLKTAIAIEITNDPKIVA